MAEENRTTAPEGSCCCPPPEREGRGFLLGLVYGLVPHTFCILFIVFSVLGVTAATSVIRQFLYVPYLFQAIVALSFLSATISAAFYLKRNRLLSLQGARFKWKYLTILYGTTIAINLLFFMVVFPLVANSDFQRQPSVVAGSGSAVEQPVTGANVGFVTLQVDIPCPGHAPLIMDELKRLDGITAIKYQFPNSFRVSYDEGRLTVQEILDLPVFQEFRASARS